MTAVHLFENGDLDLLQHSLCPLPEEVLEEHMKKGDLHLSASGGTQIIVFNTEQFPFSISKIRRAFGLAIDREVIGQTILKMGGIPAFSAIPPILKHGTEEKLLPSWDPIKVKQLFDEALNECGINHGQFPPLEFLYSSSNNNKKLVEAMQQQWQNVLGVTVSVRAVEHATFFEKFQKRQYQFAQTTWIAQYNDQMNIFERFKNKDNLKNYAGWENRKFQKLLELSQEETGEKRLAILREAEKLFLDEMPVCPLYHLNAIFLKHPYVTNLDSPYSSDLCFTKIATNFNNNTQPQYGNTSP